MKKTGRIIWIFGIISLFGSIIIKNKFVQHLLNDHEIVSVTSNDFLDKVGYNFILISVIIMLVGLFFLIADWMKSKDITEQEQQTGRKQLDEEEEMREEGIELIGKIKNNIPFTFFRTFMSTLVFLGIISTISPSQDNTKDIFIVILILIPVGLLVFYFFRKLKNQFRVIKIIKKALKENNIELLTKYKNNKG